MILRGVLVIEPLDARDLGRARDLMARYRDLPMDLVAAALVALAERRSWRSVFTLDRRGFRVYRPKGLKTFAIIP